VAIAVGSVAAATSKHFTAHHFPPLSLTFPPGKRGRRAIYEGAGQGVTERCIGN